MKPVDLIQLQINLDYQLDPQGYIVPSPFSSEQAWYVVYHYGGGYASYFSQLLPPNVRQQLLSFGPVKTFSHLDEARRLISHLYLPCKGGEEPFWSGYFHHSPKASDFPDVIQDGKGWIIKVDSQVASASFSARENKQSAEVYVETRPAFRRKGFGRQVVSAWAYHIIKVGAVPFYSYRIGNVPSANLARKLEVEWYADALCFEPV